MTTRTAGLLTVIVTASCFAGEPSIKPECDESRGVKCPAGQACVENECLNICKSVLDCAANEACLDEVCQAYSVSCANGELCAEGWYCDGSACRRDVTLGKVCNGDHECGQGHCVDGVCCSSSCDGVCMACLALRTDVMDGTCAPISHGTDPENECADDRSCSGIGTCMAYVGETCGDDIECTEGMCVSLVCQTTPSVPQLIYPTNGHYTGSCHVPRNLKPKFMWEAVAEGVPPLSYELAIDDTCSVGTFSACEFPSPEATVTVSTTTVTLEAALPVSTSQPVGRRYYWRVRACDSLGRCSGWSQVRYLEVGREQKDLNGDGYADVVVGAPAYQEAGISKGAAMVFYGGSIGLVNVGAPQVIWPTENYSGFGATVAIPGDVNADGFSDLAVGAPYHDDALTDTGRLLVYLGTASGPTTVPFVIPSPVLQQNANFGAGQVGRSSSGAAQGGDFNADGFCDLAVPATGFDGQVFNEGAVFVFTGSLSGIGTSPTRVIQNPMPTEDAYFGGVLNAGDINGDGAADLAVAVKRLIPGDSVPLPRRVDIFLGQAGVGFLETSFYCTNPRNNDQALFGIGFSLSVDMNGDGFSDMVVGSPQEPGGPTAPGALFVFPSSRQPSFADYHVVWNPDAEADVYFGMNVVGLADVNGDLLPDVVLNAPLKDVGAVQAAGAAYVIWGNDTGQPEVAATIPNPEPVPAAYFGWSGTAGAGDVNADGYSDFAVTGFQRRVHVYFGGTTATTNPPAHSLADDVGGGGTGNSFGESVD